MDTEPKDIPIKLAEPISDYFLFAEDQVLTANQLNRLARYLDLEDRRTRAWLIGSGIICGLKLVPDEESIKLTRGCALTSDGDLLTVRSTQNLTHQKPYDEEEPDYPLLQDLSSITELLTDEDAAEDDDALPLTAEDLEDKVAILYLQSYIKEPEACTNESCDQRAPRQLNNLRVLLLPKDEVSELDLTPPQVSDHLPKIEVSPVLPFSATLVGLPSNQKKQLTSNDRLLFHRTYQNAINLSRQSALAALSAVTSHKDALGQSISQSLPNWGGALKGAAASPHIDKLPTLQPLYSFYQELCEIYSSWKNSLTTLTGACGIQPVSHPKHVYLGLLDAEQGLVEEGFRHPFLRSAALGTTAESARELWNQLTDLVQRFNEPAEEEDVSISISPAARCPSLEEPNHCCTPAYQHIEGLLGISLDQATELMSERSKAGDLAADIYTLQLKSNTSIARLQELLQRLNKDPLQGALLTLPSSCPGLTHGSRVPLGGTLLLVSAETNEEDIVVATFTLPPYPVKKGRYLATPGPGWEKIFDLIPDEEDAEVHLPPGDYPVVERATISHRGNLTISGGGPGSHIFSGSESALLFEDCSNVTVKDLAVSTNLKPKQTPIKHLSGALTFLNSAAITVSDCTLTCSSSFNPVATCITVREDVEDPRSASAYRPKTSVRIENNQLYVGYQQRGLLIVNSGRTQISGNHIQLDPTAKDSSGFKKRLTVSSEQKKARKSLVEKIRHVSDPEKVPLDGRNVSITIPGLAGEIQFATAKNTTEAWKTLLEKHPPKSTASNTAVVRHIESLADKIFNDEEFVAELAATERILEKVANNVKQNTLPTSDAGITIGGIVAPDVRISGNTITGARQGIHIGLSNNKEVDTNQPLSPGSVILSENIIHTVIATDAVRAGREGIFVSGGDFLSIENNRLTITRQSGDFVRRLETDAIRIWGKLGRTIRVSHNSVERISSNNNQRFDFGIRIKHEGSFFDPMQWLVLWNQLDVKQDKVRAEKSVIIEPIPQN